MECRDLIIALGFSPKENAVGVFSKNYRQADNYCIEVDFEKQNINYGDKIQSDSKTTLNFAQPENFVVLECVNRLLEIGYQPENIVLEKTYPAGHGTSGRLDILVTHNDGTAWLMIECKTFGEEFDKELKNTQKNGGQLFTYFQQDTKTELLMLYASKLGENGFISDCRIIKVEEEFRSAGNAKEAYQRWNGKFYEKGFWENHPYNFIPEIFTKNYLRELNEIEGQSLFNKFTTILRKHSVSDKPNAFNKIFNLFLAKLYDEQKKQNDELEFHWRDDDNPVDFQVRLFNLHTKGLFAFLEKELAGIYDKDFEGYKTKEELLGKKKNVLKINKIYDIKEVFDDDSFEQNHRVLKEVVELLQQYQIRYPRKQRHLSDFFEQLLTTGLKQEVGQYFTPPTIAKFIIKSLPVSEMLEHAINQPVPSLPSAIDYAAGSGHFLTEILEEYQDIIEKMDASDFFPKAQKEIAAWIADPYNWAGKYVYGIEKDYRLVKVAKVGCYFYGDGLAQVVLGDGLDSFEKSKSYTGLLKENAKKPQFSILVSNPPYSVDYVKDDLEYIQSQNEFELYNYLTDNSDDIECLFVERAKHLLKDEGVAGVILPSSILSNEGIHTKAREIILQNFEIISIAQFGGNTFMATNTNTVVLFLRKRNEFEVKRIKEAAYRIAEKYPKTREDLTINGIEKPVKKYFEYTGEKELNHEKFYYFVLNYHQKTVVVKTGEKEDEKIFLGYKIVKRRRSEGYHSIQRGKTIDECTMLYDNCENETKANFYINKSFSGLFPKIHETMKKNVFYADLIDMLSFDRENFDKSISLSVKKKLRIESKWEQILLTNAIQNIVGSTEKIEKNNINPIGKTPVVTQEKEKFITGYSENDNPITDIPVILFGDHSCSLKYIDFNFFRGADGTVLLKPNDSFIPKYFYNVLRYLLLDLIDNRDNYERHYKYLKNLFIPLPPKEIQEKIVAEIEILELNESETSKEIEKRKRHIFSMLENFSKEKISDICRVADEKCNPQDNPDKEYLYIGLEHIESHSGTYFNNFETGRNILSAKNVFHKDDVLYGKLRPYLNKVVIAKDEGICSTDILVLKTNVPKILKYALLSDDLVKQTSDLMKGVSLPRIGIKDFLSQKIPVPPLSEQQKIVSEIEEIEKEIAYFEQQLSEIPKQKEEVFKKYLCLIYT